MGTTYTSGLRLTNQPDGGNNNTWGQIADNNFEFIDDAITAHTTVDITGSTSYTLTANNGSSDEARNACLYVIGTPTSAVNIIVPSVEKPYLVIANQATSTYSFTVKTAVGTGQTFTQGTNYAVYCDGVSVWLMGKNPVSALDPSHNLSDLTNVSAAVRTNLGIPYSFITVCASSGAVSASASGSLLQIYGGNHIVTSASASKIIVKDSLSVAATTFQYLTSGTAATYTTPAGCKAILVCMIGGGGGGAGAALSSSANGTAGGDTTFNSVTAKGGSPGTYLFAGGAGGTGGSGSATIRIPGTHGGTASFGGGNIGQVGGYGGSGPWGGGGNGGSSGGSVASGAGGTNSGSGGGGYGVAATYDSGGGGGAGEYVELYISSPGATYSYTVGSGGAGGTGSGGNGAAGASGLIKVIEYYGV